MQSIIIQIVSVMLILGFAVTAYAGKGAEEVVRQYYTQDFRGDRLSADTYDNMKPLFDWGPDRDEPGWDIAFIVDGIRVYNIRKIRNDEQEVAVRYSVIGKLSNDITFIKFIELVEYKVKFINGEWKIVSPIIYPHISPQAAAKHYRESIESYKKDPMFRENLPHDWKINEIVNDLMKIKTSVK